MHEEKMKQGTDFIQSIQESPMSEADLRVVPLLLQGIKKLELGEEVQAQDIFRDAVKQSPDSFKACYLLGRTALAQENFTEAQEALGNALALSPENIEVKYLIAYVHALQDMVEEAAGELLEILEKCPDFIDAYYDCGVALQLLGRYEEAIEIFEKRLTFSPDFETALMCAMTYEMLQDFENTEKYYAQALALDPENIMVIESRGKTLLELERYEEAMADFSLALKMEPGSPDAMCGRGQTYFHLGEIEKAECDFRETVALDPENMIAWSMIGQIKLYQEQYAEALEALEKALELDPELLVYDFRASAKRGLGDLEGALADIKLAIEYEPENADYLIDLGSILAEMDQMDEALKVFNQVVSLQKSMDAYRFRGLLFMERLEYEKAISDFDEAIRLGAENADVFLSRGEALYQLGEREKALDDFQRAKETVEADGDIEFAKKCDHFIANLKKFEDGVGNF
ncbi:MAG: tetratricopeptide repeat protein [Planctomycetaceae bacterium]|nr:tetratricopeptide repeat protein [Planctomycetaceae bacterium]